VTDDAKRRGTAVTTPRQRPEEAPEPVAGCDWESVALSRVARSVDALASPSDGSATGRFAAFGWESVARAYLRRRLRSPGEG
jgi:hypothetical protein